MRYSQAFLQPHRTLSAWAGFGQLTWHLSDSARASAGARYTEDTKQDRHGDQYRVSRRRTPPSATAVSISKASPREDIPFSPDPDSPVAGAGLLSHHRAQRRSRRTGRRSPTWRAFEYDLGEDLLAYALTNSGFKSGVIQDGGTFADPEAGRELRARAQGHLVRRRDGGEHRRILLRLLGHPAHAHRVRCARHPPAGHAQRDARAGIYGIESELLWKP